MICMMKNSYVIVDPRINQWGVMSTPIAISRFLISLNELRGSAGNLPNGNTLLFVFSTLVLNVAFSLCVTQVGLPSYWQSHFIPQKLRMGQAPKSPMSGDQFWFQVWTNTGNAREIEDFYVFIAVLLKIYKSSFHCMCATLKMSPWEDWFYRRGFQMTSSASLLWLHSAKKPQMLLSPSSLSCCMSCSSSGVSRREARHETSKVSHLRWATRHSP